MPLTADGVEAFERAIAGQRRDRLNALEAQLREALGVLGDDPFEVVPLARASHLAKRLGSFEEAPKPLLEQVRTFRDRKRALVSAYESARQALGRFEVEQALEHLNSGLSKLPWIPAAIARLRPLAGTFAVLRQVEARVPELVARGKTRRLERALACVDRTLPNPVVASIRGKLQAERDRLLSLAAIELAVLEDRTGEAASLSRQHLRRFGADERVSQNLQRHLEPLQARWLATNGPIEERVRQARARMRGPLDGDTLRTWFTTEIVAARASQATSPELVSAWSMVLANWGQVRKGQEWSEPVAERVLTDLRGRLDQLVREGAESLLEAHTPDERVQELGQGRHGWFRGSVLILPSAMAIASKDGLTWRAPGDRETAWILEALYGPWAGVAIALHRHDLVKARQLAGVLAPGAGRSEAERFLERDVQIRSLAADWEERGCADDRCDRPKWTQLAEAIRTRPAWVDLVDACFQKAFEGIQENLKRDESLTDFWYSVTRSPKARTARLDVQARLIGKDHDERRISSREAISRFEKLLKEDADHVLAREFYHIALHLRDLNEVLEGLQAGNTSYAISQARRSPEPVRERTAQALTTIAMKAIKERELPPMAARELVVAAKAIYSGSASLREVYDAFHV